MAPKVIDQLARAFLDAPLRSAGFRRRGVIWNRPRAGFVDVVDLQASRWNEPQRQSVAVNIGVVAPSAYRRCWQQDVRAPARSEDCQLRRRLADGPKGLVLDRQPDKWWTVSTEGDIEVVGRAIAELLLPVAIPSMEEVDSLPSLRTLLDRVVKLPRATPLDQIYLAIADYELGDKAEALRRLAEICTAGPGAWRERASLIRDSLIEESR